MEQDPPEKVDGNSAQVQTPSTVNSRPARIENKPSTEQPNTAPPFQPHTDHVQPPPHSAEPNHPGN